MLRKLVTFGMMGILGTPAHYLTLILLVEAGGVGPVFATSVGSVVGALVNYFLNYHYAFKSSKAHTWTPAPNSSRSPWARAYSTPCLSTWAQT